MQQIIRDSSAYYLIGYNSTQAPTDGRFHKIDVDVTRKGVDVRARKGYWAYTALTTRRVDKSASTAPPPRGRPARFWIGTARRERQVPGHVRVGAVAPAWRAPGRNEQRRHVTLSALAPDGVRCSTRVPTKAATPAGGAACRWSPGQRDIRVSARTAAVARDSAERQRGWDLD